MRISDLQKSYLKYEFVISSIFLILSAISVYLLNYTTSLDKLSSGLMVGLITYFIATILFSNLNNLPAYAYSGLFIGMSGSDDVSIQVVVLAAIVGVLVFKFFKNRLVGYGGKLGFISFLSVSLSIVIINVIGWII